LIPVTGIKVIPKISLNEPCQKILGRVLKNIFKKIKINNIFEADKSSVKSI
jgi:hypothetical protein